MFKGFPHSSVGTESACHVGDSGSIPGLGRSPGEGNGSPLQYSCLENPMDGGAGQATIYGVARVRPDLATKPPLPSMYWAILAWIQLSSKYVFLYFLTKFYLTKCILCMLSHFSCIWLCNPVDCILPGSSIHGILQARILEWVAMPSSRGSSQPRNQTWVSYIAGRFFIHWATWEAQQNVS